MPAHPSERLSGRFVHAVYSPHGGIEGIVLDVDGTTLQVVLDHHDDVAGRVVAALRPAQTVDVDAVRQPPSSKGPAAHPVYALVKLRAVDGAKPEPKRDRGPAYVGTVARLNYARHGAANGVVLDTGDFIHTKPDGFARLKLKVGDHVEADGDAHWLATGHGWAVEATRVNGKALGPK